VGAVGAAVVAVGAAGLDLQASSRP